MSGGAAQRSVRSASHAPAPFGVEVAHADLVMDGAVLLAPMDHPAAVGALAHRPALAVDGEEVLVEVAAERAPDGVVVEDALGALLCRIALEPETAELDRDLVGAER